MWPRRDPLRDPEPLIRRVYAFVEYRVSSRAEADDITGEVFVRAARYRESYDPSKGEPGTWVIGIARRVLADRFQQPDESRSAEATAAANDPSDQVIDTVDVRAAVARLPERDQELIALRYGADLSAKQIAAMLEMTPHAVDAALSRAISRLREDEHFQKGREKPGAGTVVPGEG